MTKRQAKPTNKKKYVSDFPKLVDEWHPIKNGDLTFFGSQASYLPLRFSANLGRVVITNSEEKSLSIIQSKMRVRACSPDEPQLGYPKC